MTVKPSVSEGHGKEPQGIRRIVNRYGAFIRFALVGCVNTGTYYLLYLLIMQLGGVYLISHTLAFAISMVGSFFMNCYFTYRTKPTLKKFFQFPLTYVVNYSVSTLALFVTVDWLHMNEYIAPIIALLLPIPFTFLVSKYILDK